LPEIDKTGHHGFEIIAIWQSLIVNEGTFYTDANGVDMLLRQWTTGVDNLNIPANYYPVTSMISIRDDK